MLNTLLRSRHCLQFRSFNTLSLRRYASSAAPRQPRYAPPSKPPSGADLRQASRLQGVKLIEQLYNASERNLYQAPTRLATFRFQSWLLATIGFTYVCGATLSGMTSPGYWKSVGHTYPTAIACSHIAFNAVWFGVSLLCLLRIRNQIHSVNIIKQADSAFVKVSVRRLAPFFQRHIVLRPFDIQIDGRAVASTRIPDWMVAQKLNESSPSAASASVILNTFRAMFRPVYYFFASQVQFLRQEGIVDIGLSVEENGSRKIQKGYRIDLSGDFLSEDEQAILYKVATVKKPWELDYD